VGTDIEAADPDKDGQGRLMRDAALGIVDAAREKRRTLGARVAKLAEIVAAAPDDHFLLWHDLEDERKAIEEQFPSRRWHHWGEYRDGNCHALALYERHYSAQARAEGNERKVFAGPGEKLVLMTDAKDALFVWRLEKHRQDGQDGVNCAVFRNEGQAQSSELIREAMAAAWKRWPGVRLFTFVDEDKTAGRRGKANPAGKCFIDAGWTPLGKTKGGLHILDVMPGARVPEIAPRVDFAAVFGSQKLEVNEALADAFAIGEIKDLAAKPSMLGAGRNFQYHCHRAIFAGIGFKFHDWLQAIMRIWRFLQAHEVDHRPDLCRDRGRGPAGADAQMGAAPGEAGADGRDHPDLWVAA
jgi:hypothetical protein